MKTKLILDVNKTQHAQLNYIVTGRVGDKASNIVDVYVTDNGAPYNLTGSKVFFECVKPDNTLIRDENGIKVIDAAKGHFEYTFIVETFGAIGKAKQAFFSIEKDKTVRATTQDFVLITLPDATTNHIPSESYVSDLEKLIQELNEMALSEINSQAAAEASAAKDFANKANELSISIQKQLNEIVINGDSSVEAAQARTDAGGKVHETLKDRNDSDFNALIGHINVLSQNSLAKVCQEMAAGNAVVIDCFGDSTYWGLRASAAGGGRVDIPAPAMLQTILQDYYGNTTITVNNRGISGNQTTNALRTFEAEMRKSVAQIVYINYGLNDMSGANPTGIKDPKIDAEQYRQNIRLMVTIARKYNKVVILDSPNVQLANHGGADLQFRMEGTQQFSNTMKQVATELNVPFVNQQYLTHKYLQGALNVPAAFPDGLHPSQEVYLQKGINMALPIVAPTMIKIKGPTIIPAGVPGMQATNAKHDTGTNTGSRTGIFYYSPQSIRAAIWIDEPGLDVYIATCQWSGGTLSCDFKVDGVVVGNANFKDTAYTTPVYAVDNEICILKNAKPGLHFIELSNTNSSGNIGIYYIRTYKTRDKFMSYASNKPEIVPKAIQRTVVIEDIDIESAGGSLGHVMVDVPTSRVLSTLDVEMIASLKKGDGINLFNKPSSNTAEPHAGLYAWLDFSGGYLKISEGNGPSGFINITQLDSIDHSGVQKKYRITVTPSGIATFYINGTKIGEYTMTNPHFGGFLGFYKTSSGVTRIDRVSIY
ncbi:SGNH/GDSL hydrolase family protein [Bacillus mycoides]|uniref:SGNH/GDSL hydrolase family protein n=1 Tax=Bacillus mycoides TaxID=1405 RepID=UPI0008641BAF|nr:SGNH/GDSL hydrolase family protein [Bacillus mycoides]SCM90408.1 A0A068D2V5 (GDSL-like Lipase/Acylhydrolase family protein) [Bacillus mycoides]